MEETKDAVVTVVTERAPDYYCEHCMLQVVSGIKVSEPCNYKGPHKFVPIQQSKSSTITSSLYNLLII